MSNTIDERVVEMRFENSQFERNVGTSMNTIDKLKKSLDFDQSSKSLENLEKASNGLSLTGLSGMADAVNRISDRFSAMGIVGMTVIQNLTNAATGFATTFVKSMSIDQVTEGFSKYEQEMNAVQTIMASTGQSMSQVEKQLKRVTWFTDQTSYSYSDMVNSIGKFTSTGLGLDKTVTAMEGIATWAARSGVNAQKATGAYYNLSQAIGNGYVDYANWKSIVNLNMNTKEFMTTAANTAVAMGKLKKAGNDTFTTLEGKARTLNGLFSSDQMTKDKWFTTDVFMQTMKQYGQYADAVRAECEKTGKSAEEVMQYLDAEGMTLGKNAFQNAQVCKTFTDAVNGIKDAISTQWMTSLEYIFGDLKQAEALWAAVYEILYDVFAISGDVRNSILEVWSAEKGRRDLLDAFINLANAVASVVGPIKEAWDVIFEPFTGDTLKSITGGIKDFTKSLILNVDQQSTLKTIFEGVFSVLKVGFSVIKSIADIFGTLLKALSPVGAAVFKLAGYFGSALKQFNEWLISSGLITDAVKFVQDAIEYLALKVKDFVEYLKKNEHVRDFFDLMAGAVGKLVENAKNFKLPTFAQFLDNMKNLSSLIKNSGFFKTFIDGLVKGFSSLKGVFSGGSIIGTGIQTDIISPLDILSGKAIDFTSVFKTLKDIFGKVPEMLSGFKDGIVTGFNQICDFLGKIDWDKILNIVKIVSIIALVSFSSVSKMIDQVSGVLIAFQGKLKAEAFKTRAEGIKELAISVAILAGSLIALSFIDVKSLEKGAIALGGIMAALVLLSWILGKINSNSGEIKNFKDSLLDIAKGFARSQEIMAIGVAAVAFAVAILILVHALKEIDSIDFNDLSGSLTVLGLMIVALVGSMKVIGEAVKGSATGIIATVGLIYAFLIALEALLFIIKQYDKLSNSSGDLSNAFVIMGIVIGGMIAAIVLLGNVVKSSGPQLAASAVLMLSIVYVLDKMHDAILEYSDLASQMGPNAFGGIAIMATIIAVFIASIKGLSMAVGKTNFAQLLGAAASILALAIAINMLEGAVSFFAKLNWEQIKKGLGSVIALMLALAVTSAIAGKGSVGGALSIAALSGSVLVLSVALMALSLINPARLKTAGAALSAVLGVLAIVLAFSKLSKDSAKSIVSTIAPIITLTVALCALSTVDRGGLKAAAEALSACMGVLAVVLGVSKLAKDSAAALALVSLAIVALGGSLYFIASQPVENINAATTAMGVVLGMLALVLGVSKLAKDSAASLGVVSLAIAALGASLYYIASQPVEGIYAATIAMSAVLGMLALVLGVSSLAKDSAIVLLALAGVVVIVGLVLSNLASIPDPQSVLVVAEGVSLVIVALSAALAICATAGAAVGPAIAGILLLDAFIVDLIALLAGIGKISEQYPGIEDFVNKGGQLLIQCGQILGEFIGTIVANVITTVTATFGQIGTDLSTFMTNLKPFIDGANSLKADSFDGIGSLVGAIVALSAAEFIKGIADLFTAFTGGSKSFADLGTELAGFGDAMTQFAASTANLDSGKVSAAADAALALVTFAKSIPNEGGLLAEIFGDNGVGAFAAELKPFGDGLSAFADSVKNLPVSAITNACTAATALTDFAGNIENEGGLLADVMGDNNLGLFATELLPFGTGLVNFGLVLDGLKTENVGPALNVARQLTDFAQNIQNKGGALANFIGDNDLQTFGDTLKPFGQGLVDYGDAVDGLKADAITASIPAAMAIADLANTLSNRGMANLDSAGIDFTDFQSELTSFGQGIVDYSNAVANADAGKMASISTQIRGLADTISSFSSIDFSKVSQFKTAMETFGKIGVTALITEFDNSQAKVKASIARLLSSILVALNGKAISFQTSGTNLVAGFIHGMELKYQSAYASATKFANTMCTTFNEALGENSPSKRTEESGKYFVDGHVVGVEKETPKAVDSTNNLADTLVNTYNDRLASSKINASALTDPIVNSTGIVAEAINQNYTNMAESADLSVGKVIGNVTETGKKKVNEIKTNLKNDSGQIVGIVQNGSDQVKTDWGSTFGYIENVNEDAEQSTTDTANNVVSTVTQASKNVHAVAVSTLSAEDEYWANLLALRKAGIDGEKYQDMDLVKFKQYILEQTTSIWKEYTDKLTSNADTLATSTGLFDEVNKKDAVSIDTLNKNLDDKVNQLMQYDVTLTTLNQRLGDIPLRDAIDKMGVDQLEGLKALNSMTDEQIQAYIQKYNNMIAISTNAASQQLTGLKEDTEQKLAGLWNVPDVDLTQFGQTFDAGFQSINEMVQPSQDQLNLAYDSGSQIVAGVAQGVTDSAYIATDASSALINTTLAQMRSTAQIQSPSQLFSDQVGSFITSGVASGIRSETALMFVKNACITLVDTALQKLRSMRTDWVTVGEYCADGFREGIHNKAAEIGEEAYNVAANALARAHAAVESASPSKKFMELGEYCDEGFIIGFQNLADKVGDASAEVGTSSLSAMSDAISKASDVVNSNVDMQPTIRPVLDLTDVTNGAQKINSMMNSTSMSLASNVSTGLSNTATSEGSNTPSFSFVQNNYSPTALSRLDIYRQTRNQFAMVKGLVTQS